MCRPGPTDQPIEVGSSAEDPPGRNIRLLRESLAEGDVLAVQFVDQDRRTVRSQVGLLHDEPIHRGEGASPWRPEMKVAPEES
jgi:hypothetical protein